MPRASNRVTYSCEFPQDCVLMHLLVDFPQAGILCVPQLYGLG